MSQKKQKNVDDFTLMCIIGKGKFGKILLVRERSTDKIYAMKVVKKKYLEREGKIQNILTQRSLLAEVQQAFIQMKHPFIIRILYSFQNEKKLYFVLQYCPGGELFNLLSLKERFTQQQAKFYIAQIVLALDYMHQRNIIYRDLRPQNILIDKDGYIKITDFGLSKKLKGNQQSKFSISGVPEYHPPQILLNQKGNKAVDYWCLGLMLFEMTTGYLPFYSENANQLYENIKNKPFKVDQSLNLTPELISLLSDLFIKDPIKRIGTENVEDIKKHSWFKGINWQAVLERKYKAPFVPVLTSDDDTSYFSSEITKQSLNSYDQSYSKQSLTDPKVYQSFDYATSQSH